MSLWLDILDLPTSTFIQTSGTWSEIDYNDLGCASITDNNQNLILNILILKKYVKLTLLTLALVSFFGSAIAFYHFGIEQGFFNESLICEAKNFENNLSKDELLKSLSENTISCKTVTFRVFGLSLASINTILSFILFSIFMKMYKNYERNK